MGSSQTGARTHVPCIGRRILNHCATREAPSFTFKWMQSRCRTQRVNRLSVAPPFPLPSFPLITRKSSLSLYWSVWEEGIGSTQGIGFNSAFGCYSLAQNHNGFPYFFLEPNCKEFARCGGWREHVQIGHFTFFLVTGATFSQAERWFSSSIKVLWHQIHFPWVSNFSIVLEWSSCSSFHLLCFLHQFLSCFSTLKEFPAHWLILPEKTCFLLTTGHLTVPQAGF